MKKTLRALLVAGLVALITPALIVSASADEIPGMGDLTIHKYIGGSEFGSNNGLAQDTSGWDSIPANGVVFDIYKVGKPVVADPAWPDVPARGTYKLEAGNLAVYDGTTLIGEYALTNATPNQVTTSGNGSAKASSLSKGIYFVLENAAASTNITNANNNQAMFISQVVDPFLVSVPMADPYNPGAWMTDIHVYPKNAALTVDKTVTTNPSVVVGDKVTYSISGSVPADLASANDKTKYIIWDQLDAALTLDDSSIDVYGLASPNVPLTRVDDYTVTWYDENDSTKPRTLEVALTKAGMAKVKDADKVVLTFEAEVNAKILEHDSLTIENTGNLSFTNNNGDSYDANTDGKPGATIHTAAIDITKVNHQNQPLAGAEFQIASDLDKAKAGCFIKLDADMKMFDCEDVAEAVYDAAAPWIVKPTDTGSLIDSFIGLRDYVEDAMGNKTFDTYYVVETVAPANYNKLLEPIEVSFAAAYATIEAPAEYAFRAPITVQNSQGFILPFTGGAGTIVWTVAGICLVGMALLILVPRRKKQAQPTEVA
ncbi:MAG: SpaH/EbpB family LPXTG-anchored major pilin [Propionibacteriaceae bacterium]|jgi:fimbrial isopeptide formation D2 family protein/LPXTG-motif cell wall-anchored protein|nr:SpaH/EbpB family LPXTG-anchored major pilin [Propionibacteriaceae bacterium]